MNWLSGLNIAGGRENAGSSVPVLVSLIPGHLLLSGHKAKPLSNYHEIVIGMRGQVFIFYAE